MGTRNLTIVHHDGKYKLAQYGQWDGYPGGQGKTVLQFLRRMARNKFIAALNQAWEPTEEQVKQWYCDVGGDGSGWVTMDVADQFKKNHPTLDRDMAAGILSYLQNSSAPVEIRKNLEFVKESLFCEWAYVIDLDKNTFEVFKGFNTSPLGTEDRFFFLQDEDTKKPYEGCENTYYPVRLVKSYDLTKLPTQKQFVEECDPKDKEE